MKFAMFFARVKPRRPARPQLAESAHRHVRDWADLPVYHPRAN